MRLVLDIARTGPLASRLDQNDKNPLLDHDLHDKTDEELREIVKERVETLYHPAGSCRMAPLDAGGVVDSKLRVHGIRALRVCDASIFPSIVSGHTVSTLFPGTVYVGTNEYTLYRPEQFTLSPKNWLIC